MERAKPTSSSRGRPRGRAHPAAPLSRKRPGDGIEALRRAQAMAGAGAGVQQPDQTLSVLAPGIRDAVQAACPRTANVRWAGARRRTAWRLAPSVAAGASVQFAAPSGVRPARSQRLPFAVISAAFTIRLRVGASRAPPAPRGPRRAPHQDCDGDWSATLSGWPSVTDSEVNRPRRSCPDPGFRQPSSARCPGPLRSASGTATSSWAAIRISFQAQPPTRSWESAPRSRPPSLSIEDPDRVKLLE